MLQQTLQFNEISIEHQLANCSNLLLMSDKERSTKTWLNAARKVTFLTSIKEKSLHIVEPVSSQHFLIYPELVIVIEAGRVASIADYEVGAVEVHSTFPTLHEEVGRLAHRGGAVDEGGYQRGGSVGRTGSDQVPVAVAGHPARNDILYLI